MTGAMLLSVAVVEDSQVAEARRRAVLAARGIGLDETEVGKVALIVTELATNLVSHAERGQLIIRVVSDGRSRGIEVLALDRGPGITDLSQSLRDGYSTRGGPGIGLGAIRRIATEFDIHSIPGRGTAAVARLWRAGDGPRPALWRIGAVCQPKGTETVAGDDWAFEPRPGGLAVMVVDGLGHGLGAAEAARAAVEVFRADPLLGPGAFCRKAHQALATGRGAALASLEIRIDDRSLRFAGVGNISAAMVGRAKDRHLISHNGIVGHRLTRIEELVESWADGTLLVVMHTDGIGTRWDLDSYPGLAARDPSLIAGVLYRDFARGTDDATVVVIQLRAVPGGTGSEG